MSGDLQIGFSSALNGLQLHIILPPIRVSSERPFSLRLTNHLNTPAHHIHPSVLNFIVAIIIGPISVAVWSKA